MRRTLLLLAAVALAACQTTTNTDQPRACQCQRGGDPSQCVAGWICGVELTCHDESAVSDYLCTLDSDCEGGWRCSYAGRCANPASESLLQAPRLGTLTATKISPDPGVPRVEQISRWLYDSNLTFSGDGGLYALMFSTAARTCPTRSAQRPRICASRRW